MGGVGCFGVFKGNVCVCEVHTSVMVTELPVVACWQVCTQKDISRSANNIIVLEVLYSMEVFYTITGMR